jgi:hypothetical protein
MRGGSEKKRTPRGDGDMEEKKVDDYVVASSFHSPADHIRGRFAEEFHNHDYRHHHHVVQQQQQARDERPKSPASTSARSSVASSISSSLAGTSSCTSMSPQNHMTKTVTRVIPDLASRQGNGPANALRHLFALTEHASQKDNRVALVHANDGQLVSVVLHFLQESSRENAAALDVVASTIRSTTSNMSADSSNRQEDNTNSPKKSTAAATTTTKPSNRSITSSADQYLSLLVLNNLCTAPENKRIIALDHNGAKIISSLLVDDPSCHLLAIILVNLTFSDAALRQELIAKESSCGSEGIRMIESLAFCLRVASLTSDEYEARHELLENVNNNSNNSPLDLLRALLQEDWRLLSNARAVAGARLQETFLPDKPPLFPDTARYCLVALKNLTRCFGHAICISHVHQSTSSSAAILVTVGSNNNGDRSSNRATMVVAHNTDAGDKSVSVAAGTTSSTNSTLSPPVPLTVAQVLIRTGIVSHLLRYITITDEATCVNPKSENAETTTKHEQEASTTISDIQDGENVKEIVADAKQKMSTEAASQGRSSSPPVSFEPPPPPSTTSRCRSKSSVTTTLTTRREEHAADAALFCILNLAADPSAREYLRNIDTVKFLSWIVIFCGEDHIDNSNRQKNETDAATAKLLDFNCTKAHIALAYLIGSEGHFGQPNIRRAAAGMGIIGSALPTTSDSFSPVSGGRRTTHTAQDAAFLKLSAREPLLFVELLANTIHGRGKNGPGGYSPATISTKFVLYAVRCLLTQHFNQTLFAALNSSGVGVKLNILLLKVLAWYTVSKTTKTVICDCPDDIDAETAEYAVFSLYLMSNHGVKVCFLRRIDGQQHGCVRFYRRVQHGVFFPCFHFSLYLSRLCFCHLGSGTLRSRREASLPRF